MAKSYDAIIIGAGIIGCATSLALGRKGWKVLNLDRLPAAGYGSTSGSRASVEVSEMIFCYHGLVTRSRIVASQLPG